MNLSKSHIIIHWQKEWLRKKKTPGKITFKSLHRVCQSKFSLCFCLFDFQSLGTCLWINKGFFSQYTSWFVFTKPSGVLLPSSTKYVVFFEINYCLIFPSGQSFFCHWWDVVQAYEIPIAGEYWETSNLQVLCQECAESL